MKKSVVMIAPFNTRSGYGDHARDLVWSFLENDKLEKNKYRPKMFVK